MLTSDNAIMFVNDLQAVINQDDENKTPRIFVGCLLCPNHSSATQFKESLIDGNDICRWNPMAQGMLVDVCIRLRKFFLGIYVMS